MNTLITEIKDQVAQENGYSGWADIRHAYRTSEIDAKQFENMLNQAMHRLAEHCCKEQINDCCATYIKVGSGLFEEVGAIQNTPLASDKYKP